MHAWRASDLAAQAQQAPWASEEHAAMAVVALASGEAPQSASAVLVRRRSQGFEASTNYVASSMWGQHAGG